LSVVVTLLTLSIVAAAGAALQVVQGVGALGAVVLPAAAASILVLYFDWRRTFLRRVLSDPADEVENHHTESRAHVSH